MAGAGTGKTRTLVERCLRLLIETRPRVSLDDVLLVTFTEAAAGEMRKRLRGSLVEAAQANPGDPHLAEQVVLIDTAAICTLHSFCVRLLREQFHELAIDPQFSVLDEPRSRILAADCLDRILMAHYSGKSAADQAVQHLIMTYGRGRDEAIRSLVIRTWTYAQTLPDPDAWLTERETALEPAEPARLERDLGEAFQLLKHRWRSRLARVPQENLRRCVAALDAVDAPPTRSQVAAAAAAIAGADETWPRGDKGRFREPHKAFFAAAAFLATLASPGDEGDPLRLDADWVRPHLRALLGLVREFEAGFTRAKRDLGAVDFHDLEQLALRLLWDREANGPSATAAAWRRRFRHVFVDEYQDINAAQNRIIQALSREGDDDNRFLVGDVKQSIYRFRLADPHIFQGLARDWAGPSAGDSPVIPLSDNFRSHEGILEFVNALFTGCMHAELGGIGYDAEACLRFGARAARPHYAIAENGSVPVELVLRLKSKGAARQPVDEGETSDDGEAVESSDVEQEARLAGQRLCELKHGGFLVWRESEKAFRPVEWRDMVILMRSPRQRAEKFAQVFSQLGIPLVAARGGLFGATEVSDLLNLLRLLDNPLQDLPLLAVLRSPLVELSVDELAAVRLALRRGRFWTALRAFHRQAGPASAGADPALDAALATDDESVPDNPTASVANAPAALMAARASAWPKVDLFLERYARWRERARRGALSRCLETVLDETQYEDRLLAESRAAQRQANVRRFLGFARQFDQLQHQGLFRFLRYVEDQQAVDYDPEPAAVDAGDAVRMMSIHQSKGLEFPVVVVAGLGQRFNLDDLKASIILDERHGLCSLVKPPSHERLYPSLNHWLARERQLGEALGEELRLLYVATTRACDRLILLGTVAASRARERWSGPAVDQLDPGLLRDSTCPLDWIGGLLPRLTGTESWIDAGVGSSSRLSWRIIEDPVSAPEANLGMPASPGIEPPAEGTMEPDGSIASSLDELRERLNWVYPHLAATREAAKTSVTALRRRVEEENNDEARPWFPAPTVLRRQTGELGSAARGTAHHRFLQHLALDRAESLGEIEDEAGRLTRAGLISPTERAALDLEGLARFWSSPVGRRIREQAGFIRREWEFTASFSAADLAQRSFPMAPDLDPDEFVVIQGVVDLAVIRPEEIWLVDFKTDEVGRDGLAAKVAAYSPQIVLYAAALERIHRRPVTEAWLHFLAVNETVSVPLTAAVHG